jgi:4-diphosphocytidyl-2-C-methyl-D-erythritol kinase
MRISRRERALQWSNPQAGLETKSNFFAPDLKRDSDRATILGFAAAHYDLVVMTCNQLPGLCPEVTQALEWLKQRDCMVE